MAVIRLSQKRHFKQDCAWRRIFDPSLTSGKLMRTWDANGQGVRGFGVHALLFRAKAASDTSEVVRFQCRYWQLA
jgi:hypothetical protein